MNRAKTIRLGLMAPLTGLVSLYGKEISQAGQIACEAVNEAGGVLGQALELIIVDDGSQPETAVPVARRLVTAEKCKAIIGNLLSNSRIAVDHQVAEPYGIPYLNFSFYEGSIYGRYFFHFAALPNQQIDKMIPYMAETHGPKFYFAGTNYEWPRGSISAAKSALRSCGGEVVGEKYLNFGVADFSDLLESVAKSGANVFVPYFAGSDQMALLEQFARAGLKDRMAVAMGHFDEAMLSKLPPGVGSGLYSSNTYFMSIDSGENREYLARLAQREDITGIWPHGNGVLTSFGEGAFLCVKAFAQAVNKAGCTEPDAIVEQLETIVVNGPQGRVAMDRETHHAAVNSYLVRSNARGSFDLIECFGLIEPEIPHRYRRQFGNRKQQAPVEPTKPPVSEVKGDTDQHWRILGIIGCRNIHFAGNRGDKTQPGELPQVDTYFKTITGDVDAILLMYLNSIYTYIVSNISCHHSVFVPAPDVILEKFKVTSIRLSLLMGQHSQLQVVVCVGNKHNHFQHETNIIELADTAIVSTDAAQNIIQTNGMVYDLFGYRPAELTGQPLELLIPPHLRAIHQQHVEAFVAGATTQKLMSTRRPITGYRKNGSAFPAEASIAKMPTPGGTILVATIRDISEHKNIQEELIWQANHDQLTRLPNRSLIRDRLENALARSKHSGKELALLFVDVDNFKDINDTFGHDAGDEVLIETANRLIRAVRPGDTVGRFGGDEFLILCEPIESKEEIPAIVSRVIESMRAPFHVPDKKTSDEAVFVTISIGVAYGDGDSDTPDILIKNADAAMYSAKQQGRDRWVDYENSMEANTRRFLTIANGLRTAIQNNEFHLVLQPIVDAGHSRLVGAEVLIRWLHNDMDISPSVFIPIAEATGAIHSVGAWVFEQACMLLNRWGGYFRSGRINYLSVNLSARQLTDSGLTHSIAETLRRSQVNPKHLLFEVTETAIMSDEEQGMKVLSDLGTLGLKLAIDDFGTGYSSLGKLLTLPVDNLKIDRVFIKNFRDNEKSEKLVGAIISIAHALDLKVIAEGVEDSEQFDIMKTLGCDYIQGYYFSKPVLPELFERKYFLVEKEG